MILRMQRCLEEITSNPVLKTKTLLNFGGSRGGIVGGVVHGDDASVERPTGYALVIWVGSVEPAQLNENDIFIDTST